MRISACPISIATASISVRDQFGAEPLYSREDIREVTTSRSFDLIWCGSLFTHLDRDRWADFLGFFADHLAPGGVLVFTTHGRRSIQWMVDGFYGYGLSPQEQRSLVNGYATEGFGFVSPTSQAFGISLSSTAFVCTRIERYRTLGLIGLHEAGWSDHQDVVACVKLAQAYVDAAPSTFADEVAPEAATRTVPQSARPLGNVDEPLRDVITASQLRVSGWAGDYRGISEVRVLMDEQVVAVSSLSWDRPDVSATYPEFRHGNDRHGWRTIIPPPAPGAHRLSVQAVNLDGVGAEIGARMVSVPGTSDAVTNRAGDDDAVYDEIRSRPWFYDFDLPNGSFTRSYLHESVAPIHPTRLEMLWRALEPIVQERWSEFTAIDIACHQGYFASHLARRGCRSVKAVDARAEHVAGARLIARAYNLSNLTVEQRDVSKVSAADLGVFDIALVFGLLYHVENPVGLLRLARAITRRVCLVETQIAPEIRGSVDWGSRLAQHPIVGTFGIVDETGITSEPESNLTEISLCPSLDALLWIMRRVGFSRVEVVPPPADAYEQHASGARVVVAGFVD